MSSIVYPVGLLALLWCSLALIKVRPTTVAFMLAVAGTAAAAPAVDALKDADWFARLAEGRALYRGNQFFDQTPTLHGVALPGTVATCASCHGARGEGGTEAGVAVPSIQWERLAQATPQRPAYADIAQVLNVLTAGRAIDGRSLRAPMPRFTLSAVEQQALIAYLGVLGTEDDPIAGVDGQRIVLGSVLPLGTLAGAAIRDSLLRGIDRINMAGGIFGRRLELVAVDAGADAVSASAAVAALARSGRVFALVGSLVPEPNVDLRKTLVATDTALIATLGVPVLASSDARVSWLLPSLVEQARALEAEMRRACPANTVRATRVLYLSGSILGPAMIELPDAHWEAVTDPVSVRDALHVRTGGRTIAFLPARLVAFARAELHSAGPSTRAACLGTLASLSGEGPDEASDLHELVVLPMPPVPFNEDARARAALWPLLADSALAVAAEALARAGRQLDTAKLLAALDTMHRFETPSGVVLDFSRRRRHGLDVSYLWKGGFR